MQGSRGKELNPQTGAPKYVASKRAREMVRIASSNIQNQHQSSDVGSNNVRPITEQRTLRSEYSQGARLLRAAQSQLNANAPSNVSPSPQPSIGLLPSERSRSSSFSDWNSNMPESESEGSGLVSTGYDNHGNGRPLKRNRSMSPSNGAAAGWSSTVSGQSMQVAEQAPSPDQFDEEGSDSGSESSDNEMIDDSTYDDAIYDEQQSLQNTVDDNQLNSHSPLLPVEPNSIGSQNVAAGEADDTDVIQQTPPSTPTGEEHRIIVDVNRPPNAPHRPGQIRERRPLSQRGNGRRDLGLPDDSVEYFGNFSQIHDQTQQANEVQQNTYSTLYMSIIFEALRQSNIGGDYENHPYREATRTLYHTNNEFRTFVDNLRNAFNIIIDTHGESEVRGYLETHFEQNRTYLPAEIQEDIIERANTAIQGIDFNNDLIHLAGNYSQNNHRSIQSDILLYNEGYRPDPTGRYVYFELPTGQNSTDSADHAFALGLRIYERSGENPNPEDPAGDSDQSGHDGYRSPSNGGHF